MRRGPKKVHPKLPDGKKTRAEALRIWEKVDIGKKGFVTVPEVLKQSKLLEQECPDFIRDYESVARDGRVTRTAFLGFAWGSPQQKNAHVRLTWCNYARCLMKLQAC